MPFRLSRVGRNVPAEVQRWQYFLLKQGISQVGNIDADFGMKTETATKFFQVSAGISTTGKVDDRTLAAASDRGYTILPDDHYTERSGADFPPMPSGLSSPSNSSRNRNFGCFKFIQVPIAMRPDAESIVQRGSCDGSQSDWVAANIVEFDVPQLKFARGFNGRFRCHTKAADKFKALVAKWEADDLLHLVRAFEGAFVPRYKRNKSPGNGAQPERKSIDVPDLSNHSFGSAFDINFDDNPFPGEPARCGQRGSTRELVAAANALGIFWGGHFSDQDGNHFEISKLT
jgi:hypothetical protein